MKPTPDGVEYTGTRGTYRDQGPPRKSMKCSGCNSITGTDDNFCRYCGANLKAQAKEAEIQRLEDERKKIDERLAQLKAPSQNRHNFSQ